MTWRGYILNNLLAWDIALNCLLRGRPGETLSSRAATARRDQRRWGCALCWVLDKIEREHCANAMRNDSARAAIVLIDNKL